MDLKTKIKALPLANKVKFNRHTVIGIMIAAAIVATYFVYHSFASGSDIVNVAAGQVGVHEGANNCNPYGPCEAWCADFVSWVYAHANYGQLGTQHSVDALRAQLKNLGWYHGHNGAPSPGDIIMYGSSHTGIVDHVSGSTIYSIEGNYSDQVARVTTSLGAVTDWGGPGGGVGGGGIANGGVVQGYKVQTNHQTNPALDNIGVTCVDGGCPHGATLTSNPYFFGTNHDVAAGLSRYNIGNPPGGWHLDGYIINGGGLQSGNSAVVNVPANGAVNLWWQFSQDAQTPHAAVQGVSVDTNHNKINGVIITQGDNAGDGPVHDIGTTNPTYGVSLPQGLHRISVAGAAPGWRIVGYSLCYDSTGCHGSYQSAPVWNNMSSVVVDTRGHQYADLWWHLSNGGGGTPSPSPQPSSGGSNTGSISAPSGLHVVSKTSTTVTLAWNAVAGATGYKVILGGNVIGTGRGTSMTINGLHAGNSYTFYVKSYNSSGASAKSGGVSVRL